jgi:hypothetical protein
VLGAMLEAAGFRARLERHVPVFVGDANHLDAAAVLDNCDSGPSPGLLARLTAGDQALIPPILQLSDDETVIGRSMEIKTGVTWELEGGRQAGIDFIEGRLTWPTPEAIRR